MHIVKTIKGVAGALALAIMSGLLVWRHAANLARLVQGTESRLGAKAKAEG